MEPAPAPVHACPSCRQEDAWETVRHPAGIIVVCRFCDAVLATSARARDHFFDPLGLLRDVG